MKQRYLKIISKLYSSPNKDYIEVSDEEYYSSFGLEKDDNGWEVLENKNGKNKIEFAYERAWQNRDFEINKFWTRAAYFWGFIVLIFGAYLKLQRVLLKMNILN